MSEHIEKNNIDEILTTEVNLDNVGLVDLTEEILNASVLVDRETFDKTKVPIGAIHEAWFGLVATLYTECEANSKLTPETRPVIENQLERVNTFLVEKGVLELDSVDGQAKFMKNLGFGIKE